MALRIPLDSTLLDVLALAAPDIDPGRVSRIEIEPFEVRVTHLTTTKPREHAVLVRPARVVLPATTTKEN